MSFTATEAISGAFRHIGHETRSKKASDDDYIVALQSLNTMLYMWHKLGLRLAINTKELELGDIVPYPAYTQDAIEYNLAEQIFSKFAYNQQPSPTVMQMAKSLKNDLWTIGGADVSSVFPGVMPIGEGNENYNYGNFNPFYPDCDPSIYGCNDDQLTTDANVALTGVKHDNNN